MVDVDEADVAVMSLNLAKCKDAFLNISRSLENISLRSSKTSKNIKPILQEVNTLNSRKSDIERGLVFLNEVGNTASIIASHEASLSEITLIPSYIQSINESKSYLLSLKKTMKKFTNLIISFETTIDKAELKLQSHLISLIKSINQGNLEDISYILSYLNNPSIYTKTRSNILLSKLTPLKSSTIPQERPPNVPYEKGTNGFNRFNNELIKEIKEELVWLSSLQIDGAKEVTSEVISLYHSIINSYNQFFGSTDTILTNDLLALEIIENLIHFQKFLQNYNIPSPTLERDSDFFITKISILFKEYFHIFEQRFVNVTLTDTNIPQITVDLISKLRRISEFDNSCLEVAQKFKLGDWLINKPEIRFISTYSSLIQNSESNSPTYLLSSFFSDLIDCILINIEIGLKQDVLMKKSTQGFILIKNLIMVETIINKSKSLYKCLGQIGTERLNKLKNRFLKSFLDDWNYASFIIIRDMTSIATHSAHTGGISTGSTSSLATINMTSKERDLIKKLFESFNESFEEALKNYEKYNITDINLRNYLSVEIKKLMTSAYFKVYDKYGKSDFAKNKSKYVKYDKQSFERLLNEKL